jgi:hypothetical protein
LSKKDEFFLKLPFFLGLPSFFELAFFFLALKKIAWLKWQENQKPDDSQQELRSQMTELNWTCKYV